jgi:APA family basic amino acid/polyamine antiporter
MIKKHRRKAITLKRDLGLFEATVAGIGIIVGAGIYVLIGAAAGLAGNGVWLSFVIAAFVAFLTGLSYAELCSIYTEASGEYSYVEHTFGKKFAFVVGYLVMFAGIIGAAAVSLGFAGYFNNLIGFSNPIITALGILLLFTLINIKGIKQSMRLNSIFTVISILGLLFIIIFALPELGSVDYMNFTSMQGIFKASSLIFFAYLGFDSVVQLSEETKNPRKNIPLALLLALAISTVIYILVAFSSISVIGWEALGTSSSPLADVATALLGSNVGILLTIIALLSTSNTILLELVAMSRLIYGMSKSYVKLNFLSQVNKITKTPVKAIIKTTVLASLFVLIGKIDTVASMTNFAVFIVFIAINLALIKSRYIKHRKEMFHEPLNIGKFPVLAGLGVILTFFMMFNLELSVILLGSVITMFGFLIFKLIEK